MAQKKIQPTTTYLLRLGSVIRESIGTIQLLVGVFVAAVALVVSLRTQPLLDDLRSLDFRTSAIETRDTNIENELKTITRVQTEQGVILGRLDERTLLIQKQRQ